jgi:hypothetical protein
MIVKDADAIKRLESPMNLINRLRRETVNEKKNNAMSLFGMNRKRDESMPLAAVESHTLAAPKQIEEALVSFNPFQHPPSSSQVPSSTSLDNILENHDAQIKLGLAHDSALKLLNDSISQLAAKLDDVRADRLPAVISAASKTVESIRKERNENSKSNKDREVHYHFYTPTQKPISDYEVIDVT